MKYVSLCFEMFSHSEHLQVEHSEYRIDVHWQPLDLLKHKFNIEGHLNDNNRLSIIFMVFFMHSACIHIASFFHAISLELRTSAESHHWHCLALLVIASLLNSFSLGNQFRRCFNTAFLFAFPTQHINRAPLPERKKKRFAFKLKLFCKYCLMCGYWNRLSGICLCILLLIWLPFIIHRMTSIFHPDSEVLSVTRQNFSSAATSPFYVHGNSCCFGFIRHSAAFVCHLNSMSSIRINTKG